MSNLFFHLPPELQQIIYVFDSTYKEHFCNVLNSLPLFKKQQLLPGGERWIFVLTTREHSEIVSNSIKYYNSQELNEYYRNFCSIGETRIYAVLEKYLSKAIFKFMKTFKL